MKKLAGVSILSLMLACALCLISIEKPVHAQQMFQSLNYPTGLLGWWKLCGDTTAAGGCTPSSSTTAFDSSGYGNNGTWTGTQSGTNNWYSAGQVGPWAGFFNGTNNGVASNNVASLIAGNGSVSYTAWIYLPATYNSSSSAETIVAMDDSPCNNCALLTLGLWPSQTKDGKLHMYIYSGSAYVSNTPSKSSWASGWYFVAGTYSSAHGVIGYINGVIDGSAAAVTRGASGGVHFSIGYRNTGSPTFFSGLINDVRVYNRELSAAEIAQMYLAHN